MIVGAAATSCTLNMKAPLLYCDPPLDYAPYALIARYPGHKELTLAREGWETSGDTRRYGLGRAAGIENWRRSPRPTVKLPDKRIGDGAITSTPDSFHLGCCNIRVSGACENLACMRTLGTRWYQRRYWRNEGQDGGKRV